MKPELQRRIQRYGWDRAADHYELVWKEQLKPAQDNLLDMAGLQPGESILETACGTGLVTFRTAQSVLPGGEVVATDLSEEMINLAKKESNKRRVENVTYIRMDAEKLHFDDNRFDAAMNALGLMYIPEPVQSLKEMHRVLKPGGRALIAIWGERKKCGWAELFPIVDKRVSSDVCPLFFQQGTGNALEKSLTDAGFKTIEVRRFSTKLHYSSEDLAIKAAFAGGPVALAYKNFDEKNRREAHAEYLDSIKQYRNGKGYQIPGEFVVARGFKR